MMCTHELELKVAVFSNIFRPLLSITLIHEQIEKTLEKGCWKLVTRERLGKVQKFGYNLPAWELALQN